MLTASPGYAIRTWTRRRILRNRDAGVAGICRSPAMIEVDRAGSGLGTDSAIDRRSVFSKLVIKRLLKNRKENVMSAGDDIQGKLGSGVYHPGARPMKVVKDAKGELWLCDKDVDPERNLPSQGCWRCGGRAFTRND